MQPVITGGVVIAHLNQPFFPEPNRLDPNPSLLKVIGPVTLYLYADGCGSDPSMLYPKAASTCCVNVIVCHSVATSTQVDVHSGGGGGGGGGGGAVSENHESTFSSYSLFNSIVLHMLEGGSIGGSPKLSSGNP